MFRFLMALACAALALALGACGKDDDSVGGTPSGTVTTAPTKTTGTKTTKGNTKTTKGNTKTTKATPPGRGKSRDVLRVAIKNKKFLPHDVVVHLGQKVRWANTDKIVHNVVATKGASFASKSIEGGDTFSYTPRKIGTINYVCTIHPGQNGRIIVRK